MIQDHFLVQIASAGTKISKMSIHEAAKEGNISELKRLLSDDKDNMRLEDKCGYLPLHVAVQYGQQKAAKVLLQKGADEYAQTANAFKTALHIAAATNNMFFLDLLDNNRINLAIKARDKYGYTPLHVAVRAEDQQAVMTLLEKGADMEAKSHEGETALLYAVRKDNRSIANLLLENGADVHARDNKGNSVLHKAENYGTYGMLNSHYVNFWQEDNFHENHDGQTPLHLAAKRCNNFVVEDMCKRGANPTQEDNAGHTALYFACADHTDSRSAHEGSRLETIRSLEYYAELQREDPAAYYFKRKRFQGI